MIMNISSEIIVGIITAVAAVYSTTIYNKRKTAVSNKDDFIALVKANQSFRDEIRGDLRSARRRIDVLEADLEIAKVTITKMHGELEVAKTTIKKLEEEIAEKNNIINRLSKNSK
jgi:peptidoglycan hydrolase CwlO-like protein